jgi:hypothetical protein
VTVVGHAAMITAGEFVQLSGNWVNDRTHGLQFRASFLRATPPTTLEGIERYLGSGMIRGIGPVYARKLVRAFGEAVFDLIEQAPAWCTDPPDGTRSRAGVAGCVLPPRVLTLPFKLNQDRRHHIPRQRHKITNWPAYDAGLRQRGSLTVCFSEEAIAAWAAEPRSTRGGQPWYSPLAILTALTLRAVFRLAYRQAEGLIGSIIGLLGLTLHVPDHTTLSRRSATLVVPRPQPATADDGVWPLHLLVDSTGLKLCGAGEWLLEKHGTKMRRSWRKLHLGVDAGTGRIVASALTTKAVDDGAQTGALLEQITDPVASFTGDGSYDQDAVYAAVAERHPEAARPPSPMHHREGPHGLAASLRLQQACQGRGSGRSMETGDR